MIKLKQKNQSKLCVKKDLNHRSDKPNPKYIKITLPLSKSDEERFSSMSQEDERIPRKPSKKKKGKYQNPQSLRMK